LKILLSGGGRDFTIQSRRFVIMNENMAGNKKKSARRTNPEFIKYWAEALDSSLRAVVKNETLLKEIYEKPNKIGKGDMSKEAVARWANALLQSIHANRDLLTEEELKQIFKKPGAKCCDDYMNWVAVYGYDRDTCDLDDYLRATDLHVHRVLDKKGGCYIRNDDVFWDFEAEGHCACPLVNEGLLELNSTLCFCTLMNCAQMIEEITQCPVSQARLQETVAHGDQNCIPVVTLPLEYQEKRYQYQTNPHPQETWAEYSDLRKKKR
jgi:hypothetical protein